MKCHYCKYLSGAQKVKKGKLCPIKEKVITDETDWCKNFNTRKSFWCNANKQWIGLESCEYRATTNDFKFENCDAGCSQYRVITVILEKRERKRKKIRERSRKKRERKLKPRIKKQKRILKHRK